MLHHGEIVEQGPPKELMLKADGAFLSLVKMQRKDRIMVEESMDKIDDDIMLSDLEVDLNLEREIMPI